MTPQRTIELSANGRNRRTHQIPLVLAALVLGSSTIVAGAQSFTNTSRAGGSRLAPGVGVPSRSSAQHNAVVTACKCIEVGRCHNRSSAQYNAAFACHWKTAESAQSGQYPAQSR